MSCESSNGPISDKAEEILIQKNISIIPDILCNSGGVVVSYYEWLQNKRCEYWNENIVLEKLSKLMKDTFNQVYKKHLDEKISMRIACYIIATNRLQEIIRKKQIY